MGQSVRQVTRDRMIPRMNTFSNLYSGDTYGNGNVKKRNRFYELNNSSALASRYLYISLPSLHNYDDLK